jgi:outer membrane scaffolding protein for murein synthesis (MipA/OmpV family)
VEVLDLTVGIAEYTYPHQTIQDGDGSVRATPGTREVFVTVGKEDLPLSPSASVYYDCDEVNGFYGLMSVSQGFEVTKGFSVDATLSLGAANTDYNETYFGVDENALNDGNMKVGASYTVNDSISLGGYVMYTYLLDSSIRDAAKENDALFNKGNILSGGISFGYSF